MKFQSIVALALAAKATSVVADSDLCLAKCETIDDLGGFHEECTYLVSRDIYSSELGYYRFSGKDGLCEGTNPTLGMKKGASYIFDQSDDTNYYHPMGFAYETDGALTDSFELEPSISGPECCTNIEKPCPEDILCSPDTDCESYNTCPAPMYFKDGFSLSTYYNNPLLGPELFQEPILPFPESDNFGLDDYEPEFFLPFGDWKESTYSVRLFFPLGDKFSNDFFYFCHIHAGMSGRIKFVDDDGDAITPGKNPALQYEYQVPSAYDKTCGTYGLEAFQLPNTQCPEKFVCDAPADGAVSVFAGCIESMDCAMVVGMTTKVNYNSAAALFIHQMIPHHQNAVNMCKALLFSGETDCDDSTSEEPNCQLNVICYEIINAQNAQIQAMQGILEELGLDPSADCEVIIPGIPDVPREPSSSDDESSDSSSDSSSKSKSTKTSKKKKEAKRA